MLTLPRTAFKAALICAATKDVRHYLAGVHIERTSTGSVHVASTDGRLLFVGTISAPECSQAGPWRLTVPLDVAKQAAKGKGTVTLTALPDGRYELDGRVFSPVDGKFPDWRRVIPANPSGELAHFNHQLLADAQQAVATWGGLKNPSPVGVKMNGLGAALLGHPEVSARAVVMPLRDAADFPRAYFEPFEG